MYKKVSKGWLKHFDFMLIDLISLEISYLLSYAIRHGFQGIFQNRLYAQSFFILALMQTVIVFFFESFKNVLKRGYLAECSITMKNVILVIAFFSLFLFATQEGGSYSRAVLLWIAVLYFLLSYSTRLLWKRLLFRRRNSTGVRSMLIVTTSDMLGNVADNFANHNYEGYRLVGAVLLDRDHAGKSFYGIPIIANKDNVAEYACREWVDEVLVTLPQEMPLCEELIDKFAAMGITVHLVLAKAANMRGKKQCVEHIAGYTVLSTSINMASPKDLMLKRMMDICGGLVGCLLTGILFLFVAPAIYMASPGPIFFSQTRVGKNGRKFKIYKFRSMYMDAEARKAELMEKNRVSDGMMFKLDYDPRIIGCKDGKGGGIGNFIRRTSIDETPQFWNVLKGDMSLVGTRPPTVDEWEKYELHHRARLAIRPGLTGMWQANGRSSITDFEKVVEMDTEYIENWSFGLDARLLLKTVLVVLGKKGSM